MGSLMVQLVTFVQQSNVAPHRQVEMPYYLLILFVDDDTENSDGDNGYVKEQIMVVWNLKKLFLFSLPVLVQFSLD